MIKKVLLLIIVLAIGGGAFFIFSSTKHSATSTTTLSERTKAYLSEQQKNVNSDLHYARIGNTEDKAGAFVGKRVSVGDCFSFVMVFRVTNPRQDGDCNWYFGIEEPKGMITAYMLPASNISSAEDIDGVSMREKFSDKYSKEQKVINGVTYLIFKETDTGTYQASAFALVSGKALFFNLITQDPDNYDQQFESMLGSIEMGK